MEWVDVFIGLVLGIGAIVPLFFLRASCSRMMITVTAIFLAVGAMGFSHTIIRPAYQGWRFEQEIKKQPLFQGIAERYPVEFSKFLEEVKHFPADTAASDVTRLSAQMVNKIFYQSLCQAPDEIIMHYLKATVNLYNYLIKEDPSLVLQLENGNFKSTQTVDAVYSKKAFHALLNHLLDSKRYVIETGDKKLANLPNEKFSEHLLQKVIDKVSSNYGQQAVQDAFSPNQDPASASHAARIIIRFYEEIIGTGSESAGIIMRHIRDLKVHPDKK